jgi:5-deoxy-D-glucuronate isomerase
MKRVVVLLFVLVGLVSTAASASNFATITFAGRVVDMAPNEILAIVQPVSVSVNGQSQTHYAVVSAPTGRTIATFTTLDLATRYASQVTVQIAYR